MERLDAVLARQAATLDAVKAEHLFVQNLIQQIKDLTASGDISADASAKLLANEDAIDAEVVKDEPAPS